MGTTIIETRDAGPLFYRIVILDNKYTIYVRSKDEENDPKNEDDSKFAALVSFDSLNEARKFLDTQI